MLPSFVTIIRQNIIVTASESEIPPKWRHLKLVLVIAKVFKEQEISSVKICSLTYDYFVVVVAAAAFKPFEVSKIEQ